MEDSHQQYPEFITKGSLIEVSSEEEGFQGAWFVATVVNPPSSANFPLSSKKKKSLTQKDKVYVEYKTLCVDEKLSLPLREYVDVVFVRPPPPIDDTSPVFEMYDVVDAFYKDGWWTGVITRIFEESRFVVTFQNPQDELEFLSSDLRLHVDWLKDAWFRPPKQKIPGLMFSEGKEVEVSLKRKHNQDVWYPATIVENHYDSSFLVEYLTLKEGTDETECHKVTVDFSHIRPSPPRLKDRFFDLLEKVDAFHELGWWTGLITKELPDKRYTVFFQSMKRDREFDYADIRPQLNWKDGKWWFTSSQEEVTPCQENPGGFVDSELNDISSGRSCKSKVTPKGKKMKQKAPVSCGSRESNPWEILSDSPCIPEGVLVGTNLEETEFSSSCLRENQNDHVELGHEKSHRVASSSKKANHTLKITRGDAATPSRTSSQQNTTMRCKKNGGINFTNGSPPSNIPGDNLLTDFTCRDQPSDNPSWGMRTPKKQKNMDAREKHMLSSRRKTGQAAGEEGNNGFAKGAELVERDSEGKDFGIAFVLGLECCKSSSSKADKTRLNNGKECPKVERDKKKKLNNWPEQDKGDQSEAGKSSDKRKRGRPRKVSASSGNAEMTGLLPAENYPTPNGDCLKLVCAQSNRRNDSGSTIRKSSSRLSTDSNDQALISEQRQTKKAKRRASENKISDSSDGTFVKPFEPLCNSKEVIQTVQQEPGMLDDQPLSTWFGKMHSPGTVNSSTSTAMMLEESIELRQTRKELSGQTTSPEDNKNAAVMIEEEHAQNLVLVDVDTMVEKSAKSGETRKELNGQTNIDARSHVLEDGDSRIVSTGEPELPFVKNSSLWEIFESMEAFRKMPQKPHFRPLQQYKESSREGYAIAFMVNFSSAVERISCLQFDDAKEKTDDIMDSLKDLEIHGFEVQALRDRITELQSIKEIHKKLHQEVDDINRQIVTCKFDKFDQDKEISEVTKQIKKLQERIAKADAIKEMKDREILVLESRLHEAEGTIGRARSCYEGLASGIL